MAGHAVTQTKQGRGFGLTIIPAQASPMKEHCPDCSSRLHHFRSGGSLVVRCSSPACAWEVATSFPVPIFCDDVRYSISIPPLPDASAAVLITLNQGFTHGIPVTRTLAIRGELPPFVGSALETWHEAQRLRGAGIPFQIEPSYPFDLDTPSSAFGIPDGPIIADPPASA